jgi:hypothetical protein
MFDNLPELFLFLRMDTEKLKPILSSHYVPYHGGFDFYLWVTIPHIELEAQDLPLRRPGLSRQGTAAH